MSYHLHALQQLLVAYGVRTSGDRVEAALTSYRMRSIGAWQAHLEENKEGVKKGLFWWASQTNNNMDHMDGRAVIHATGVPNGSHIITDRLWEVIYEGYIGQCRDQSASNQLDARTTHQVTWQPWLWSLLALGPGPCPSPWLRISDPCSWSPALGPVHSSPVQRSPVMSSPTQPSPVQSMGPQ